jgi:hypothetical protein
VDERFRDALRRNALLSEVLGEGYQPSADAALRTRLLGELARARRRRLAAVAVALAAAALVAFAPLGRAPVPPLAQAIVVSPPAAAPLMEVVSTEAARPRMEIVRTESSSTMVIVRTEASFDLARDEDLLRSPRVLAIVGHPGGPRRLFVAP